MNAIRTASLAMLALAIGVTGCAAVASDADESIDDNGNALEGGFGSGQVSSWDGATSTLTVAVDGGLVKLHENPGTIHGVEDPNEFSPGACRTITNIWNSSVQGTPPTLPFPKLYDHLAQHGCRVFFIRSGSINADGSSNLVEAHPIP